MRILALEPYYGGSHKAFLDGWTSRSRHEWTVIGLPAYRWKWRTRHAGYTFAESLTARVKRGERWDALFCSDMLHLPEFLGLAPPPLRSLPAVAYFHENQLTYPDPHATERDLHYGLANVLSALASTSVWFNSAYHREAFLKAIPRLIAQMPDFPPDRPAERIWNKARVLPQGIEAFPKRPEGGLRPSGPLRILWAARWEHDKDPDTFFAALRLARAKGADFRLAALGQVFNRTPEVFEAARSEFADRTECWGYLDSREEYARTLMETDVFVSTAIHEFFGVSAAEAIAAGNYPLLPHRLAYPELLAGEEGGAPEKEFFHDGSAEGLAGRLVDLSARVAAGNDIWDGRPFRARGCVERFFWDRLAPGLDDALDEVVDGGTC